MQQTIAKALHVFLVLLSLLSFSCGDETRITTTSQEALQLYNEGVGHLQKFYYTEAKSAFERAAQTDSSFAMAFARLAMVHHRNENEAAASAEIANALRKSATASRYEQMFIRMLDHWYHYRHGEAGAVADSMISVYPKEAEIYVLRGNIFEYTKNFDAALEMYRAGVEADTSYAPATMSLGYAHSSRGDLDKAIEAMERYIRLVPNEADPRASLADILSRVGRYDDALEQYQKSLDIKPGYWYSIARLGDVYTVWGRLKAAERQFDLGMQQRVMNNQLRASHLAIEGVLHYLRGNYEETTRLCEQSLALDSTNARAAFVRVHALLKLKNFKEAEEMIREIRQELSRRNLSESMAMLEFHLLRAEFFEEQNMFSEALAACDSAMEYGSEFTRSEVYRELADILLKQGQYERAFDALEGALRYNSNSPEALLILAKVYKATGDRQMAQEIGSRLLELWKDADPDYQNLIELKKILGRSRAVAGADGG